MNAHTNAVSDSRFETGAIAETKMRATRPFYWSIRRELWENRSIYLAPLAAAGLAVLATLFNAIRGGGNLLERDASQQLLALETQWNMTGLLVMGVTLIVAIFYSLDAFYGERRDRSIFFWRSLPVSDTVTVLSKASIPLVVIPLLTFAIAAVTQWIVLAIDAAQLASDGRSLSVIGHVPILQIQAGLLYHLVTVHSLWYAPLFAWLLLVSAWARRMPVLWAIIPVMVIEVVEKIAFNTAHFAHYLAYRIGGAPTASTGVSMEMASSPLSGMNPGHFLTSPGLWGGLIVAALFLAAAIQLRRYRAPS